MTVSRMVIINTKTNTTSTRYPPSTPPQTSTAGCRSLARAITPAKTCAFLGLPTALRKSGRPALNRPDPSLIRHSATPFHAEVNSHDLDLDTDFNFSSLSSSPISTQSILSGYSGVDSSPLSAFDSIPTPTAAPRGAFGGSLFETSPQSNPATLAESSASLFANSDPMQTDTWMPSGQLTPRTIGRFSHHRESSLSSLGSNGPASPFSHNTSNPQIAVTDSLDGFHGFSNPEDFNYQLATTKFPGVTHDTLYTNLGAYAAAAPNPITGFPPISGVKRRNDRGLLQPSEHPTGGVPNQRSQPVSVASSIASESPATPAGDLEEDRRHKNGEASDMFSFTSTDPNPSLQCRIDAAMHTVPKLDRTMTDVYGDELYTPDFMPVTTSSTQLPVSPTSNDLFVQRIQAANNQHLTAGVHSPVSATSRDRSPFQANSPLAPMPLNDFSAMGASQARFGSAQQMREQNKAIQDRAVQRQMGQSVNARTPPTTISPKDAVLEFHEPEGEANFPLFPQQNNNNTNTNNTNTNNTNNFNMDAITKAAATMSQPAFDGLPIAMDTFMFNAPLSSGLSNGLQIPQQYPFIAQPRQQSTVPSLSNGSLSTSRVGSADTSSDSIHNSPPKRPDNVSADGGTYTCTYHGCKLRFETPALLQKHKREGHRQAHGLSTRRADAHGMTSALTMTQAGPHRCDRINPSTGKPCNTVFSRPYDLTRHEDTIHNARKQKVRCNLCTDEKTFSRADALTRHYRVCHPDVEFPGKQRRRGVHSG
ncbi:hypothetical protein QBC35DRAFT_88991 [Podospora australis]|uniref:C2H2-type domain-containing protein n=1 Tax=Podospora australis TaxID=1536484 RepID=A0AAN6WZU8_9PEZI|nr:hypothetical protein QBC35DRAFT_88991 [Podospora australis]